MTARLFWKSAILTGLAAIALMTVPSARADIILTISEDGNPGANFGPSVIAAGSPTAGGGAGIASSAFTGTFGDFAITNGSSGQSQTAILSQAFTTALNIVNLTSIAHTLRITIQATGFTQPVPIALVTSSFSGTTVGGPNSGSLQSSVGTLGANSPGIQSPTLDPSFNNTRTTTATGLSAPYSIFQSIVLTLAGGGNVNFTARTTLSAVPEPATVAMALTSLPLLGIGALVRRRRQAPV